MASCEDVAGCAGKTTEPTINQDELIMKQQRQIEQEVKSMYCKLSLFVCHPKTVDWTNLLDFR